MTFSSFAGFDFGTSNCAIGLYQDGRPTLVSLPDHGSYMPSTLFAPTRDVISGWLYQKLKQKNMADVYQNARAQHIETSLGALREAMLDGFDSELLFGQQAFDAYMEDPFDCYYVKSPKSFLGASGLSARHCQWFEDIIAATMWHMRGQVAQATGEYPDKVVIGRPVNFQGLNSEQSNRQAISILTQAAKFAGFSQIEFLYEPLAAGLTYQASLKEPKRVLVVDIGGGTTDISMMEMDPNFDYKFDHQRLVLGYSGERIGGNDFDIALNLQTLMPHLGMNQTLANGQPMPHKIYYDAACVNDLPAQSHFYSRESEKLLLDLKDDMQSDYWQRLHRLKHEQLTQSLNRSAEQSKIALGDSIEYQCYLDYLEDGLQIFVYQQQLKQASEKLTRALSSLIHEVLTQSGCQPDVLFLTGGSANSPVIKRFLAEHFQGIQQVSADNFGSVTEGLTRWARQIYS
ncbi:putative chaperone protein [Celerinatantimonas diazotrophica]|uniref:Putative chaperone protein n=2 Tax=Celerinatantimonas diazotrophica TaxID=412034 RepID=A0A4R1JC09_9GAMM|nr:putative chaperone protein [Celerinatantimonas diazotrophica]CAG9296677.1 Chaperone protein DnaK [Celerinatantimonas diazotrophica]